VTEEDAMDSDPVSVAQAQSEALRLAAAIAAGRPPRVLVADDNDVNRMIAETLLGHLGCLVETANDGAQAVSASQATPFDLILMDVSMPVMNGLDATRAIRAREKALGRRTPIVALTAHALDEHLGRCLDAGMDGRLVKPFRPDQLARTVAHFLAPPSDDSRVAG
jgi:CheY-like chemotaxis protein